MQIKETLIGRKGTNTNTKGNKKPGQDERPARHKKSPKKSFKRSQSRYFGCNKVEKMAENVVSPHQGRRMRRLMCIAFDEDIVI